MTAESPTPFDSNAHLDKKPPRCADKRCNCPVEEEGKYCDVACEDETSTNYCSCIHVACGSPRCARKGCKCRVAEKGQLCSDDCKGESAKTTYCQCVHDDCYRECDLVMKGGITSGIVYPPLVYKLHEDNYRFRCIGGTSAGAIAAAVTAAAEYGRSCGGFEKLNKVKQQLGKGTFLRDLFQPTEETSPLYNILLNAAQVKTGERGAAKKKGAGRKVFEVIRKLRQASPLKFIGITIVGALVGAGLALLISMMVKWSLPSPPYGGLIAVLILFAIVGGLVGYVATVIWQGRNLYKILTQKVPDNYFGMCTGYKVDSMPRDKEVLTDWLNKTINDLAAITDENQPLSFGMLKSKEYLNQLEGEEGIQLRMVTSNLSQNQPYVLPFKNHLLIYKEADFKKFFPKEVVEFMKEKAAKRPSYDLSELKGYYFLPEADDLPVVVATRLSLSFPLLLCALPLHTIVPQKVEEAKQKATVKLKRDDLKRNWFSDGGIASNFPIQFFDAWLPTRPTFGVNLVSLPEESFEEGFVSEVYGLGRKLKDEVNSPIANPASPEVRKVTGGETGTPASDENITRAIYLPKADDPLYTEWVPLTEKDGDKETPSLFKFFWSIFTTAQNYRDNMQAMLPSYRERIVQIRLSDDEGGLNLAMSENTINNVVEKGRLAGELLTDFDFQVHQWVRFRLLMSQMEQYMGKTYEVAREGSRDNDKRLFDYLHLIEQAKRDNNYPFRPREKKEGEEEWGEVAKKRMKLMGEFIAKWEQDKPRLSEEPPLPESVLRIMPEL